MQGTVGTKGTVGDADGCLWKFAFSFGGGVPFVPTVSLCRRRPLHLKPPPFSANVLWDGCDSEFQFYGWL